MRFLVNRLRMQHDINRHPEILQEDISDPIIVIGLGRSGTTKLHKMLSSADNVHKTFFWRMINPSRFPDSVAGQPDPRIAAVNSDRTAEKSPELAAAHYIDAEEVEEEWMLYQFTFEDWIWCQFTPCYEYFDWVMRRPSLPAFRYVKQMLQYLQWQDGGKRGRPWVLKTVGYIANMDALLACYPNATFVHMHRDPRETIPSYAKVQSLMWSQQGNPVDPHVVGRETLKMWSTAMRRYLETRNRLKLNDRILDVKYETIRTDPMSVIREVYRRANRELTDAEHQKMAAWHNNNEQHRFGRHDYSLQAFGLTEADVDQAFDQYIRRFIKR